jgi:hypothetical protein
MTKQEFINRQQAYKNDLKTLKGRSILALIVSVIVFVVVFATVLGIEAMVYVKVHVKEQGLAIPLAAGIWSIAFVIPFTVGRHFLIQFIKAKLTKAGLVCDTCGNLFVGANARAVLAKGCCSRCGKKVID